MQKNISGKEERVGGGGMNSWGKNRDTAMNMMVSPVLPRYKYGMVSYRLGNKTKAAHSLNKPRIILHPERQQKYRRFAEPDRFIKGE